MASVTSVRVEDNSQEVLSEEQMKILAVLEAIGGQAEAYAKEDCPVDTGRLRNSISHDNDEDTVYIGTNVEYAPQVELLDRSHRTGKAHFLRDAASTHGEEYRQIAEDIMKSN